MVWQRWNDWDGWAFLPDQLLVDSSSNMNIWIFCECYGMLSSSQTILCVFSLIIIIRAWCRAGKQDSLKISKMMELWPQYEVIVDVFVYFVNI